MDATVYLPTVAWRTIARNVIVLTAETISDPATYRVTVKPEDINELGAIAVDIAINYYFKDYIGHTYRIIAYSKANPSAITIDIADEFRVGVGAQEGRMAIVYKSVGDGLSPYLAPIYYRHLDKSALEYSRQAELDILWKHRLFTYVAYASDNIGTGFSRTDASLPFQALLESIVEITTPVVGDFVGLWRSGSGQVNTDWNASGTVAELLNKPQIIQFTYFT